MSHSPEDEALYKECFELFSKDGGNNISTKEIGLALVELGLLDKEEMDPATEGHENWDMDIEFEEFAAEDVEYEDRPVDLAGVKALIGWKKERMPPPAVVAIPNPVAEAPTEEEPKVEEPCDEEGPPPVNTRLAGIGACLICTILGLAIAAECLPFVWSDTIHMQQGVAYTVQQGVAYTGFYLKRNGKEDTAFILDDTLDYGGSQVYDLTPDNSDNLTNCVKSMRAAFFFQLFAEILLVLNLGMYFMPGMANAAASLAGCTGCFLLIALILGGAACRDDLQCTNTDNDSPGGCPDSTKTWELSIGFHLQLWAVILTCCNCGIAGQMKREAEANAAGDGGVVMARMEMGGGPPPAMGDSDAPAPPGGVYMKNGMWFDQNDKPIPKE